MAAYLYEWRQPPTPCADSKPIQPLFLLWWDKLPQTPLGFVQGTARGASAETETSCFWLELASQIQRVKENSLAIQRSVDQELKHAGRKTRGQRNANSHHEFAGLGSSLVLFGVASQSIMNLIRHSNMKQVRSAFGFVKWGMILNQDLNNIKLV